MPAGTCHSKQLYPSSCLYFHQMSAHAGSGYLCELGDELDIISHEPKKTSDFSNSGGGGPIFDGIYLSLISHYSLDRDNVPKICDLPVE